MSMAQQVDLSISSIGALQDARFTRYEALIKRWQPAINLVSPSTLGEIKTRHIADSMQIYSYLSDLYGPIADLGSGAGFPGMVLAMMGIPRMELIESDARKCAFLQTVARETGTEVTIRHSRIEALPARSYEAVTARACAPLARLLALAHPLLKEGGCCFFLKGRGHAAEIEAARTSWQFELAEHISETAAQSRLLILSRLRPLPVHPSKTPA